MKHRRMLSAASRSVSCFSWPTKSHFCSVLRPLRQRLSLTLLFACLATTAGATLTALSFQAVQDDALDSNHPVFPRGIAGIGLNGFEITATALARTIPGLAANPEVSYLRIADVAPQSISVPLMDDSIGSAPMTNHFVSSSSRTGRDSQVKSDSDNALLAGLTSTSGTITTALNFTASQLQMLATYIANGGENPFRYDVHLSNNGIKFATSLTPIPEIEAIYPMISLLTAVVCTHLLRRRRSVQVQAIQILKG